MVIPLTGCISAATATPQTASVTVTFDLAGGGSGFSLTIYAQDVITGKTYSLLYSSSAHGQVVLPTSPPVVFTVEAPGTYVFYSNMLNAPEDYHFGANGLREWVYESFSRLLFGLPLLTALQTRYCPKMRYSLSAEI